MNGRKIRKRKRRKLWSAEKTNEFPIVRKNSKRMGAGGGIKGKEIESVRKSGSLIFSTQFFLFNIRNKSFGISILTPYRALLPPERYWNINTCWINEFSFLKNFPLSMVTLLILLRRPQGCLKHQSKKIDYDVLNIAFPNSCNKGCFPLHDE